MRTAGAKYGNKKKNIKKIVEWKEKNNGSKALLIEGARRIGKSTVVEEIGKNEYKTYILIDFNIASKKTKEAFYDLNNLDLFFNTLQLEYNKRLYKRESLIIFDEVQKFPKAREAIKYLVQDGRFDYIETGSLISIKENVEVKNNSDIASAGDLILNAHSADNVGASTYVSAASLVGAGARLNTITDITNNNNIKVDNSNLKTHSNAASVTLSAADDVKLYSVSTAEMTGSIIGGVAIATDKNTIDRNNKIEMGNGASIFSNRDINYYAGKLEDGSLATFDAATYAIAFNSAFIPFDTDPTVKNDFKQNNIINIANGAVSNSVRNTNLYADVGFEIIKVLEGQYIGLWNSKEKKNFAVTKQEGDLNPLRTTANKVTVDGNVTAGVANNIKIDIGTEPH